MANSLIALTGGTGFIGRHLLRVLLGQGVRVRALHRPASSLPPEFLESIEWVEGNMTDEDSWHRLAAGADVVIHLGAAGVANLRDPIAALDQNLPAYRLLLAAAARQGVRRVIVAGSCFEYGSTGDTLLPDGRLRESDPLAPVNAYAASKAAGTLLLGPLSRDLGLECVVLRPFHTYGEGEPAARLLPFVIESALAGREVATTDGRQIRDLVHVTEVAAAFARAASFAWPLPGPGSLVLNLGTGEAVSLREVIAALVAHCDRGPELIRFGAVPHRPNEMWRLVADPTAAAEVLGWRSQVSWREGVAAMVASRKAALAAGRQPAA